MGVLFLVWAFLMLITGEAVPFTSLRSRPAYGKTAYSRWFRIAGGIYVFSFILDLVLPDLGPVNAVIKVAALIAFVFAIFKALSPPIL